MRPETASSAALSAEDTSLTETINGLVARICSHPISDQEFHVQTLKLLMQVTEPRLEVSTKTFTALMACKTFNRHHFNLAAYFELLKSFTPEQQKEILLNVDLYRNFTKLSDSPDTQQVYVEFLETFKSTLSDSPEVILALLEKTNESGINIRINLAKRGSPESLEKYFGLLTSLSKGIEDVERSKAIKNRCLKLMKVGKESFLHSLLYNNLLYDQNSQEKMALQYFRFIEDSLDGGADIEPLLQLITNGEYAEDRKDWFSSEIYSTELRAMPKAIEACLNIFIKIISKIKSTETPNLAEKLMPQAIKALLFKKLGWLSAFRGATSIPLKKYCDFITELYTERKLSLTEAIESFKTIPYIANGYSDGERLLSSHAGIITSGNYDVEKTNLILKFLSNLAASASTEEDRNAFKNFFFLRCADHNRISHDPPLLGEGRITFSQKILYLAQRGIGLDLTSLLKIIQANIFSENQLWQFAILQKSLETAGAASPDSFNFALSAHNSDTPFGRYLLLATHGSAEAKASKAALSEPLAAILQGNITKVYTFIASGGLTGNQLKGLAFLKEALAAYMKTLTEPQRTHAHVDALVKESPLGQFFYEARGTTAPSIEKGVLKTIHNELNLYPRDSLFSSLKDGFRTDQFGALAFLESDLVKHLGNTLSDEEFWAHYQGVMNMSRPNEFFRYYFVLNGNKLLTSDAPMMRNLNLMLASKAQLFAEKITSGAITRKSFSVDSLREIQDTFLRAIQGLANHESKPLLTRTLKENDTLQAFFSDRQPELQALLARLNAVSSSIVTAAHASRGGLFGRWGAAATATTTVIDTDNAPHPLAIDDAKL